MLFYLNPYHFGGGDYLFVVFSDDLVIVILYIINMKLIDYKGV